MTRKDSIVLSALSVVFLVSVYFSNPVIFQLAVLMYVLLFSYELLNYIRGKQNEGIVWSYLRKFEALYGRFFVKIIMSMAALFVFLVTIFSIYRGWQ